MSTPCSSTWFAAVDLHPWYCGSKRLCCYCLWTEERSPDTRL